MYVYIYIYITFGSSHEFKTNSARMQKTDTILRWPVDKADLRRDSTTISPTMVSDKRSLEVVNNILPEA